jgi:cytochrome P450
MFERWVLEDTNIDGHPIAKGTKVGLLFGSANHDESVFEDSERLDLSRAPNPHVSFGAGVHHCVGAPLARVELEAALGRFVRRINEIELVDVGDRIESLVFRGVRRLELDVVPA